MSSFSKSSKSTRAMKRTDDWSARNPGERQSESVSPLFAPYLYSRRRINCFFPRTFTKGSQKPKAPAESRENMPGCRGFGRSPLFLSLSLFLPPSIFPLSLSFSHISFSLRVYRPLPLLDILLIFRVLPSCRRETSIGEIFRARNHRFHCFLSFFLSFFLFFFAIPRCRTKWRRIAVE